MTSKDELRAELTRLHDEYQREYRSADRWYKAWSDSRFDTLNMADELRAAATEAYERGRLEGERTGFRTGEREGRRYAADHARARVAELQERLRGL